MSSDLKHKIEAILFVSGEGIAIKKFAKLVNSEEAKIVEALEELKNDYKDRGIVLLSRENEWQFGTNPKYTKSVEELVKSDLGEELTRAGLETLTIIAYKGPITRADVEYIRGVNSSFTIRNLLMRGLIDRETNPKDARTYIYKPSFDFLKYLGLEKVEDLPEYKELSQEGIEKIEVD